MRILISGNYHEQMDDESRAAWAELDAEVMPKRPEHLELAAALHRPSSMLREDSASSLLRRAMEAIGGRS